MIRVTIEITPGGGVVEVRTEEVVSGQAQFSRSSYYIADEIKIIDRRPKAEPKSEAAS